MGLGIAVVVFIALAVVLGIVVKFNTIETSRRSDVARVKADLRTLATGLEAYYVDHNSYPAWTSLSGSNKWTGADGMGHINACAGWRFGNHAGAAQIHSFRVRTAHPNDPVVGAANTFLMLTTPISYLTKLMPDPFADSLNVTYGYYSTARGYIIYSFGPDRDEIPTTTGLVGDIDHAIEATDLPNIINGEPELLYNPDVSNPTLTLLCGPDSAWATARGAGAFTYDPTNGQTSQGDVWRVKN